MSYLSNSIAKRKSLIIYLSPCLIFFSFLYAIILRLAESAIRLCKYLT
jgi:hypothetical protein